MRQKNRVFSFLLLLTLCLPTSFFALENTTTSLSLPLVKIGVLANRPKNHIKTQWEPLAKYLNVTLPNYHFEIYPFTYQDIDADIANQKLDFIITNPIHYVILRKRFALSLTLATIAMVENGVETTHFGGVIFTRNDENTIHTLQDIKGKSIAITNQNSLGGFYAQAYELFQLGINLEEETTLLSAGVPYENIFHRVLSHSADVGFIRTGILEKMVLEGKFKKDDFKIIKAASIPDFPVLLSTKLYPEWPLAALAHVNEKLVRNVTSSVLKLEENGLISQSIGIYGFRIPANYDDVEKILQEMHIPPFENAFSATIQELWNTYRTVILVGTTILFLFLWYSLFVLWRKNRQLSESEFLYNKLSEHTKTMDWEVTAEGLYTYVSPHTESLLGYTPQEIVGKLFFYDLCPQEDKEAFTQKVYNRFETKGEYYHHERRILKKNGEILWVAVYGMPILDKNGILKGYRGSNTDISARKVALDELKESEARFKVLHNASFGGIAIHEQGLMLECNEGLSKLFGYTRQELIGMDSLLLISPQTRDFVITHIQQNYEKPYEAEGMHKNGTLFPIRVEGRSIPYQGRDVRVVEFRDITNDKKAQERLQLAAKVFETAREAIIITDKNEIIIDVNDAFSHITGYSREEALGQTPRMLSSDYHPKEFFTTMWQSILQKGHWYGEIWNKRKNGELYIELATFTAICDVNNEIQHYIALFSDITTIKQHEHQLEHIALHDALTNLPNRLLFAERLHQGMIQAKRHEQSLVVAYLDLDGFKTINDTYGHEIGDQLLITLATYMKDTLREGDTLARMGGDEFVAVFQDVNSVESTLPMLKRLLDAAATNITIGSINLQVSASLGVTFYPQSEDLEADQLLRQADQAMYQAKLAGKNRYHIFDSIQDRSVRDFHESLEHIRHALQANEFVLYYQPKINMRTGALSGVEALIRWNHPERGILSPAEFLPIIENHSLSIDLGNWVITTALQQITQWQHEGLSIPISINIGAQQLQDKGFLDNLRASLAAYPTVEPSFLSLEILETSALEDLVGVSFLMKECLLLGVHFAMDDFGTGYSSLTYLKKLPISLLKIDQSFVRDMLEDTDDLSILKGILGLATAFNTEIIAEGVETIEHGEMLLQLGCELAQGYGIARPMPAEKISPWLDSWKPHPSWMEITPIESKHFHFLLAIVKHRAWLKPIENYILKKISLPPTIRNADECDFSMWIETKALSPYNKTHIQTIKRLHRELHSLAEESCMLQGRGEHKQAMLGLETMHTISYTMCDILKQLSYAKPKTPKKDQKYA
ncbi:MAG: EAL domain-containing protein [Sulfurospirillaceae bacterium]|nr:EAL domain-containing protein [Sulfurospirillaceae bacterium]MDD2827526.1 EAL domain-containing protein [Sulfurospirillaceae bacterium]